MKRHLPPLWLFACVLVMTALHYLVPGWTVVPGSLRCSGVVPIVAGVLLAGWSVLMFLCAGTTIRPFHESSALVTTGPFRFSRNPIYVGMVWVLLGFAILFGSLTGFAVVPLFVVLIDRAFIVGEERMLIATFPDEYERYCGHVRRWI